MQAHKSKEKRLIEMLGSKETPIFGLLNDIFEVHFPLASEVSRLNVFL